MRTLVGAAMTLWTLVIASVVYPLLAHVDIARGKNVGDVVTEIRIERTVYISPDWCANAEIGKTYPAQIDKGHTTVRLRVGQSTCKYHVVDTRPIRARTFQFLLVAGRFSRSVRRSSRVDDCSVAGKAGEKWRHFQRHLAARRSDGHRRGLDQFRMVIPGVELDASAQRQGRDLVQLVGIEGRSRVHQHHHTIHGALMVGEASAQVGSQQRRKRWAP